MQAIIITSYKDKENLIRLIRSFDENSNLYIHIDNKSKDIEISDLDALNLKNLYVIKKYNITWGSYNHLLAIIDLLIEALKNKKNEYFHIISGQDIKVLSNRMFKNYFDNSKTIYMSVTEMSMFNKRIKKRYTKGCINSSYSKNKFLHVADLIYGLFRNNKRIGEFTEIYKGVIWCSMPREPMNYVMSYIKNNELYMNDLKHCIVPEEFFFQTIIMNSKYKDNVIKNNLRYTDWNTRNNSCPAYLDSTDYKKILESDCVFARKIDSNISKDLIDKITNIDSTL